jgi:cytochrome c oxidase cbb3-type subunit 2
VAIVAVLLAALSGAVGFAQEAHIGNLTGNLKRGKELYRRYCVGCHGVLGDGQGENAIHLDPRPRDFNAGIFKCRSTPTGSLPLESDLFDTIGRGIHASGMPAWFPLTRHERVDLLAYVKFLSPRFQQEKPGLPISIPPETASTPDSVARGKQLYKKMECWKCHGQGGHGDGPSASTLTDSKDRPIVPYDFTAGERFKCGESNQDLYRIFMTGLDGTPMPSYADNLKPEQAWDLVHFLRTLQVNPDKQIAQRLRELTKHNGHGNGAPSEKATAEAKVETGGQ